jgi:Short C-terminal domain/HIRAN domain
MTTNVELSPANVDAHWRSGDAWLTWESPRNFVAGESHYMPALRELTGEPRESGYLIPVEVVFVREPTNQYDANAWRAEVDGRLIGYARRHLAAQLAAALDPHGLTTFTVCGVLRGGSLDAPNLGVHVWPERRPCPGPELHQVDEALSVPWPPSGAEGVHCSSDEEQRLARPSFSTDSRPAQDRFDDCLRWGRETIASGGPEDRALEALKAASAIAIASENADQKEAAGALAGQLMSYARGTLTLERAARIKKRLEPKARSAKQVAAVAEERLARLKDLLERGVITDDEYAAQRAAIIKQL